MIDQQLHPRVSVGLPVFNGEKYLAETIESILAQSMRDIELIIADNASTDGTEGIARHFARADSRVRYVRNERNLGVADNFNIAFQSADPASLYFRWCAYDDTLEPTYLAKCVARLEADQHLVACHARGWRIDSNGHRIGVLPLCPTLETGTAPQRFGAIVASVEYPIWSVFRASALRRTRPMGRYPDSDLTTLAELTLMGPFAQVDEPLYSLREHADAYTAGGRTWEQDLRWWGAAGWSPKVFQAPLAYCHHTAAAWRSDIGVGAKLLCGLYVARASAHFSWKLSSRIVSRFLTARKMRDVEQDDGRHVNGVHRTVVASHADTGGRHVAADK